MNKPVDIGIVEIDNMGFINRWYPADRKKFISEYLPEGPGWVPEHYLSFICNFCDGAWISPRFFTHNDKNIKNNQPENISIIKQISDSCVFDNINDITDFGILPQPKEKFETTLILGGFFQNKIYTVPKINRCELCGLPIFGYPYQTDYMDNALCIDCYRDYYNEEDDMTNIKLLTSDSYDPIYNVFIDYNRGLNKEQLLKKYNDLNLIKAVIENKQLLRDDLLNFID